MEESQVVLFGTILEEIANRLKENTDLLKDIQAQVKSIKEEQTKSIKLNEVEPEPEDIGIVTDIELRYSNDHLTNVGIRTRSHMVTIIREDVNGVPNDISFLMAKLNASGIKYRRNDLSGIEDGILVRIFKYSEGTLTAAVGYEYEPYDRTRIYLKFNKDLDNPAAVEESFNFARRTEDVYVI
jgi:hypothetical protein